ncbi:MAG: choice-of-anchor D domain-containing protein, partial [Thermoleophilia bacterium]|nr:choice-of-anchor D domain-containing protein [Thermoleophilia bacterium]
ERDAGITGFDWVTHYRDPQDGESDLALPIALLPAPVVAVRDRFTDVEAVSGWDLNDDLNGDSGPHPANNDLSAAGIARIAGLQAVVGTGVTSFSGDRNIILGGGGSDTMEGRGGDDIIDGDKWLKVQIQAPDQSTPSTTDTKLVDSMAAVRDDVFSGKTDPGTLVIKRSIETTPAGVGVDKVVYSGARADYDITPNLNSTEMTIAHVRNVGGKPDGTDTVRNVEQLVFTDQTVTIGPNALLSPNRTFAARAINTTSPAQSVSLTNTGNGPLAISSIAVAGTSLGDFAISTNTCGATLGAGLNCTINVTFRPTAAGTRTAVLRATDNSSNVPGSIQEVILAGTGTIGPPVNHPPTGLPVLVDQTPQVGQTLQVNTAAIADVDGLGLFSFQWQQTTSAGNVATFANITGATNPSLVLAGGVTGIATVGRRFRVRVSYTDGIGTNEALFTAASARTSLLPNTTVTGLSVRAKSNAPVSVAAVVPAGARTMNISVFRMPTGRSVAARKLVGIALRPTPRSVRHTFKLTEPKLRHLKPGYYQVEVRVGANKQQLGPAMTRTVKING